MFSKNKSGSAGYSWTSVPEDPLRLRIMRLSTEGPHPWLTKVTLHSEIRTDYPTVSLPLEGHWKNVAHTVTRCDVTESMANQPKTEHLWKKSDSS
jgi:hypothetical protein